MELLFNFLLSGVCPHVHAAAADVTATHSAPVRLASCVIYIRAVVTTMSGEEKKKQLLKTVPHKHLADTSLEISLLIVDVIINFW